MPNPTETLATLAALETARALLTALGHLTDADAQELAARARQALALPPDVPVRRSLHADHFTLAERLRALYPLTFEQQALLYPKLLAKVLYEWHQRYDDHPLVVQGLEVFPEADAEWVDAIIQGYIAQFPGLLSRVQED
jgi:hypothetical protein